MPARIQGSRSARLQTVLRSSASVTRSWWTMPSRSSLATAAWKQPNFLASMRYVVRLSHLSEADKRAYVLADNKLAEKAGWDRELLAIELQGLIDLDFEVELTGFEMGEIDLILESAYEVKGEA